MRFLGVILVLLTSMAFCDAVWEYPFTELGAVWEYNGNWGATADGPFYDHSMSGQYGQQSSFTTECTCMLTMPDWCDSVTIEMSTCFQHDGYTMDAGVESGMIIEFDLVRYDQIIYDRTDSHSTWDYMSFDVTDSESLFQTFDTSSSNDCEIAFSVYRSGYGYLWSTHLNWTLSDFTITGYGVTSLESHTWASIKDLF
jgi:hypothetical protein